MSIDYMQLLKDSFNFAWKYKALWVFGFFMALFGGGGGGNFDFNSLSELDRSNSSGIDRETISAQISNFFSDPTGWIVLGLVILFFIFLVVIGWYLLNVSKVALINAVKLDADGQIGEIKVGNLWQMSHKFLLRIFLSDLMFFGIGVLLGVALMVPIVLLSMIPCLGFLVLLVLMIPLILLLIAFSIIYQTSQVLIVLSDLGPVDAFKRAFSLFRRNLKEFIISTLAMLLPMIGLGIVYFILLFVLAIPVALIFLAVFASSGYVAALVVLVIGVLIIALGLSIFQAPVEVFYQAYFTKFLLMLDWEKAE